MQVTNRSGWKAPAVDKMPFSMARCHTHSKALLTVTHNIPNSALDEHTWILDNEKMGGIICKGRILLKCTGKSDFEKSSRGRKLKKASSCNVIPNKSTPVDVAKGDNKLSALQFQY